jgi:acid phosphatase type 7
LNMNLRGYPARFAVALWIGVGLSGWVDLEAATITRGPYLQLATPTSITIRWRTDEAANSRVQYGLSSDALTSTKDDSVSTTEHEVTLTDLTPDTRYFYSVGTSSTVLASADANQFFYTHPTGGKARPTRIWVVGDAGAGNDAQAKVRDAYAAYTGKQHTDLWLQLGDNAYRKGTEGEYQTNNFQMYTNMYRKSVSWPTIGNHDKDMAVYKQNFTLPTKGEAGGLPSGDEAYYSFDYGNIHFMCLNSMGDLANGGAQWMWTSNDLAQTTAKWVIAYWHHPPYSKGSHDSDKPGSLEEKMRTIFLPLLEHGGVDLVLTGHSHSYERSFFIDGHYGVSTTFDPAKHVKLPGDGRAEGKGIYKKSGGANQGVVYVVGGSSAFTTGGLLNHPANFSSQNILGSLILDIDGDRLDMKFLTDTQQVNDYFTIEKSGESVERPQP